MDKTLTIVDAPSITGGSVESLNERIQDLMRPLPVDQENNEERQAINWQYDEGRFPATASLPHAAVQFEDG